MVVGGGTEELSSLTFALHFCFVLNSAGRAHASVSHSGGGHGGRGTKRGTALHYPLRHRG